MYYFNELKDDNGYIYSCDNIRLEFQLSSNSDLLIGVSQFCLAYCENYFQSFKSFSYKYCFNFSLSEKVSFTVLVGLNVYGKIKPCLLVDFNPNKCMLFEKFKMIMSYLFEYFYMFDGGKGNFLKDVVIKRYDLAIDIPCDRKFLSVVWNGKGAKHYEFYQNTIDDKTEYFGIRNSVGRIKVYNKSLEDLKNQSKDMKKKYNEGLLPRYTRIEITHNSLDSLLVYSSLPCAFTKYDINYLPLDFSPVDYILVNSCRENSKYIPYLKATRGGKWKKLKSYILDCPVNYDIEVISDILFQVCCYTDISAYAINRSQSLNEYINRLVKNSFDYSVITFGNDFFECSNDDDTINIDDYEFIGE